MNFPYHTLFIYKAIHTYFVRMDIPVSSGDWITVWREWREKNESNHKITVIITGNYATAEKFS